MKYTIKQKLHSTFIRLLIIPILIISIFIILLFMTLRGYMFTQIENIEIQKAQQILITRIQREETFFKDEKKFHTNINLNNRLQELLNKKKPYNAQIVLLDEKEKLFAFSSSLSKKELQTIYPFFIKILHKHLTIKKISFQQQPFFILYSPFKSLHANLFILVKQEYVLSTLYSIQDILKIIVIMLLVSFLIIIYSVYLYSLKKFEQLSNNIITPLEQLTIVSSDIEKYKKNLPQFQTNITEIDKLGKNFICMIKSLDVKRKELKEFNLTLEEKVYTATKKIKDKNLMTEKLLATVMEAVSIYDENYKLIEINETCYQIFGYNTDDNMLGKSIFDFIPKEELYKVEESLKNTSIVPYEINLYKKGDILFPALVKGSNTYINNKLHRIVTVIDLSDVKEKDKLLILQSKQAQMGEMISMIAHQWRQPLNAISASSINLSLLSSMDILEKEKIQESSEFIQDQCQQMSSTIDTFMNFVKPSKESKYFKLSDTIHNIIHIMYGQLQNHNISIITDEIDKDIKIKGHQDLLEQVILNILTNARDAFDEQQIEKKRITISILKQEQIPTIIIEDNAGGIPKNIQDKIFNPYFTTKKQDKGTGIGLYMSKDIMQKSFHGNLIFHEKELGSCFEIIFNK